MRNNKGSFKKIGPLILQIIMCLALILCLSACGSSKDSSKETQAETAQEPDADAGQEETAAVDKETSADAGREESADAEKETAVDAGQEESADAEKETAVEQPESSEEEGGQVKQDPDQAIAAGKPLIGTFETLDLDGNTVTEDIFSKADVTFVNVWGTFCPPCIAEMPDLEQIHQELPDNMQMIGILCDVESMDVPQYQEALEIVKETGVTYPSLIGNGSMTGLLQSVYAVPTSFFVDSNGCMIGAPVVGANLDAYKILLEELEVEYGMD